MQNGDILSAASVLQVVEVVVDTVNSFQRLSIGILTQGLKIRHQKVVMYQEDQQKKQTQQISNKHN